jgi:hypothetical protein
MYLLEHVYAREFALVKEFEKKIGVIPDPNQNSLGVGIVKFPTRESYNFFMGATVADEDLDLFHLEDIDHVPMRVSRWIDDHRTLNAELIYAHSDYADAKTRYDEHQQSDASIHKWRTREYGGSAPLLVFEFPSNDRCLLLVSRGAFPHILATRSLDRNVDEIEMSWVTEDIHSRMDFYKLMIVGGSVVMDYCPEEVIDSIFLYPRCQATQDVDLSVFYSLVHQIAKSYKILSEHSGIWADRPIGFIEKLELTLNITKDSVLVNKQEVLKVLADIFQARSLVTSIYDLKILARKLTEFIKTIDEHLDSWEDDHV